MKEHTVIRRFSGLNTCLHALAFGLITVCVYAAEPDKEVAPSLRLGKRLFLENQFTNPGSNFAASCRSCHLPEWAPEGRRAYADSLRYSLIPTNSRARKRTTVRNVPTLLDVAEQKRFSHDGRYSSLEDAIAGEFVSLHMGWLPEEREFALDQVHSTLLYDAGVDKIAEGTYIEQFQRVYGVDLDKATREEAVGWVVKCLAEYVTSLKSTRTSSFDAFSYMNRIRRGPSEGEAPDAYGDSILMRLTNLENRAAAKIHPGFSKEAYEGFKIFMRTSGEAKTGNCVACHTPPLFTDGAFHNTGVAQANYDSIHGDGAFAEVDIPEATARPMVSFMPKLEKGQQIHPDLGHWNFGDSASKTSIATFKTPTLRNLMYSDPYMHNGVFETLEEAITQKVKACALVKSESLRNADVSFSVMNITHEDIGPLVAFLNTLNDLPVEEFEEHRRSGSSLTELR